MTTEVRVPELGESVIEATISTWMVKVGDAVNAGDVLVELETDKVSLEVEAPVGGVVAKLAAEEGADVTIGDIIAEISGDGTAPAAAPAAPAAEPTPTPAAAAPAPAQPAPSGSGANATPVAARMAQAEGVALDSVAGTGAGGRVTKQDVTAHLQGGTAPVAAPAAAPSMPAAPAPAAGPVMKLFADERGEERVKMSRRRRTIAKRLVEVQHTAAMLTTFNEIDMYNVMKLRKERKVAFEERTGTRLGFMSFFVKACVAALKKFPRINAEIDGDEMVLKHYYDIGIAVGAEEGLVVPVVRNCDKMGFADIESEIRALGKKARDNELSIEDMVGGTFTITNGGVFGSLLSTPILNAPQVGILGMHAINEKPVVMDGEIVIRPIMMVALSYDHRIVDGAEAVRFLYLVKELIEDPELLLLEG